MKRHSKTSGTPDQFFTPMNCIEIKYGGEDRLLVLNKHPNIFAIKALTTLQSDQLRVIQGLERLFERGGQSVFKISNDMEIPEIGTLCCIDHEQIITPLYTNVSGDLMIPAGTIYLRFQEKTTEAQINEILQKHQLVIFKTKKNNLIIKAIHPLQDLVQIAYELQQNANITVAEPEFLLELQACAASALSNFSPLRVMNSEENDRAAPSTSTKSMSDLINIAGGSPLNPRRKPGSSTPEQDFIPQEVQTPNLSPVNKDTHHNCDAIRQRMFDRAKLKNPSAVTSHSPTMASIPRTMVTIPKIKFVFGEPGEESAISRNSPW